MGSSWTYPGVRRPSGKRETAPYCGRAVDGTVVTFDDGATARFPGRGTLAAVRDGSAEFVV